jgi:hypothetical protein
MQQIAMVQGEAALWRKLIRPDENGLTPEAARSLLQISFSDNDVARMNELAQKNREGNLSDEERRELEAYVKVGDVLSLIHLKARKSVKN